MYLVDDGNLATELVHVIFVNAVSINAHTPACCLEQELHDGHDLDFPRYQKSK